MTLFKKIIDGELPSEKLFENEHLIAIKDKYPVAPVHILIITKKIIPSLAEIAPEDLFLIGEIVAIAQKLAQELGIAQSGYRLLTNVGRHAGQEIPHLHFHLLGGAKLSHL